MSKKAKAVAEPVEVDGMPKDRQEVVAGISKALVDGAHSLYIRPIVVNPKLKSKISRLPLTTWLNAKQGRYFVPELLAQRFQCTMTDLAYALYHLHTEKLAYVDTVGVDVDDLKAVQDVLAEAFFKRGTSGASNAVLDTTAKIYVRDLKQPKPTNKGKASKPVIVPAWLTGDVEEPEEQGAA